MENEPPFYLETTEESYCVVDYMRICILTVHRFHFRDSAILKLVKLQKTVLLKQSKCMRF